MNAIEIYENAIRMLEINGEITLGEFEDMIKPLEDVTPVVHGEWIYDGVETRCSVCGDIEELEDSQRWDSNYCPNCGAKMDGDI